MCLQPSSKEDDAVTPELRALLDAPMDRLGTNCEKWDKLERHFGRPDLIAMWVADMDFPTAPEVQAAIVERAKHPIYGYTENGEAERAAETGWLLRRHGLRVDPAWILYSPGVVDSIHFAINALTRPGESVLVQPPVYGPFYSAPRLFERPIVRSPLKLTAEGWRMDFEDLEAKVAAGARLMLLCNPHNPVGRVWTKAELETLVALARRYGAVIVDDEIHAEFALDGRKTVRLLSVEGASECVVMLTSATKAFNLAGLRQSSAIVADPELRRKLKAEIDRCHASSPNIFGAIAQAAAYTHGDAWMDAVVEYVAENRDYAVDFLRRELPEIGCVPPEGTYLMWLDMRALGLEQPALMRFLVDRARIAVNDGLFFGEQGRGWVRVNLATQRANVTKTLDNLRDAIRSR